MPRHGGTKRVPRKWEVFPGRNNFLCNGRIVMAQRAGLFYLCVFIIVLTSALFFAFDCPYLAVNVTPAVPVIAAVLFIFVMSNLFKTSFSDPGILPRATKDEAADIERQIEVQTVVGNGTAYRPPPRTKEIVIKSHTMKLKYCFTCKIFRPPRASHCSICDNCVDRFDHHCPWVGNCVGLRNYRYFYLFLVSLAIQCVFFFTCALSHLVLISREKDKGNFLDAIRETPSSVVVCVICFLSVWSVLGLAGFHTYLVTSNLTTNEDIKGSFSNKRTHGNYNPFHAGNGILNCVHVLCSPLPPTLIDPRGFATEDYLAQRVSHNSATSQKNGDILAPTPSNIVMHNFQVSYNESTVPNELNPGIVSSRRASQTTEKSFTESAADIPSNSDAQSVVKLGLPESNNTTLNGDGYSNMRVATTMPEISSILQQQTVVPRLPPMTLSSSPEKRLKKKKIDQIVSSQSEHALSMHNIGLHNEKLAAQDIHKRLVPAASNGSKIDRPMDLDQTTMIGSALDLDSLSGDEERVGGHVRDLEDDDSRISTGAGSQVGLLKMTYTAA